MLFDVNLGAIPTPVNLPPPGYGKKPRSPAYFRRQEKCHQEQSKSKADEVKLESSDVVAEVASDEEAAGNNDFSIEDLNSRSVSKDPGRDDVSSTRNTENVADNVIVAEESKDEEDD